MAGHGLDVLDYGLGRGEIVQRSSTDMKIRNLVSAGYPEVGVGEARADAADERLTPSV